jgi:methylated-DNA-[protein]-cysteine S-methyltransferase
MSTFTDKVLKVVKEIPRGKTLSYKEVAILAGNEKASRVVGTIMSKNWDESIPCHRVICSDGTLGGYNRGTEKKRLRLEEEGAIERK